MTRDEILSYSQAVCDGLREDEDGVRREVLTHAGSRWSLGVIHTLGVYGRLRHAEIGRRMHGVTNLRETAWSHAMIWWRCRHAWNTSLLSWEWGY